MVLGALACEKAGIAPEFFIRITMKLYGPLLFLLLLLAGLTGKKGKSIKTGLLALVLLGMSGCGVSLENRVFPMSMGVDYENGHYRIVYGIPQLSKVTGQDKEETQSGEEQALVYEGLTPTDGLYGAWHREEEFPILPEVTIVNKKPSIRQHSG